MIARRYRETMRKYEESKLTSSRTGPPLFWSLAARAAPKTRSLQHSASFPVYSNTAPSWRQVRRPLPPTPPTTPSATHQLQTKQNKQRHSHSYTQGQTFVKREVQRRQTFHHYPAYIPRHDTEDHIYEEIEDKGDWEDSDEDGVYDHSFLSLISSERRRNLKLYGLTDWDYGSKERS